MPSKSTVHSVTYDLLRKLGLTTVFGNPGSTEQTFLADFPDDFQYILGLQEASVLAMADGFAQAIGKPALVNLHSSPGVGNALGNLVAAARGNTPLIITSGQQHRELVIGECYLANKDATEFPKPWVKWAYEPARAEDVPEAFMRAYAIALEPPAGPVYLSIPLDDWNKPLEGPATLRTVSTRMFPDEERLKMFADRISACSRPALVFGPEVDRAGGWDAAVALAEKLNAAVYGAPLPDRASFPEEHPLYAGPLGISQKSISERLSAHDLAVIIGAEVFRYYPYVPGPYLPSGTQLLQITADPNVASTARAGDSLLGDTKIAIEHLVELVADGSGRAAPKPMDRPRKVPDASSHPMTPAEVYAALSKVKPENAVLVTESTSTQPQQQEWLPTVKPKSFYATASGGIGWGTPAAVGVALGLRAIGDDRPVIATIGDGSFQYSVQSIWSAAQHKVPVVYVVMRNKEYSILKSFAVLEETPNVPGLDLPGLDVAAAGRAFGCNAVEVHNSEDLEHEVTSALKADGPSVIVVHTKPENAGLA